MTTAQRGLSPEASICSIQKMLSRIDSSVFAAAHVDVPDAGLRDSGHAERADLVRLRLVQLSLSALVQVASDALELHVQLRILQAFLVCGDGGLGGLHRRELALAHGRGHQHDPDLRHDHPVRQSLEVLIVGLADERVTARQVHGLFLGQDPEVVEHEIVQDLLVVVRAAQHLDGHVERVRDFLARHAHGFDGDVVALSRLQSMSSNTTSG